jgi:pyridoxal phosphate enzyme (YggS family)
VRLVAVSKTFPAASVRALRAQGQELFGENRVQEALEKIMQVGPGATWHLVGHLQRNKVRHAVGVFELIHGVDSLELGREIDRRAAAGGFVQPVLLQVNLAGETTKSGLAESELASVAAAVAELTALDLRGLMTIPPPASDAEQSRPWFARLHELREDCAQRLGRRLPELSMGMSDDFEVAIEEGATLIRVGRALFGERLVE